MTADSILTMKSFYPYPVHNCSMSVCYLNIRRHRRHRRRQLEDCKIIFRVHATPNQTRAYPVHLDVKCEHRPLTMMPSKLFLITCAELPSS